MIYSECEQIKKVVNKSTIQILYNIVSDLSDQLPN